MKTNIFNIQKSRPHNGSQNRTVIFFKGCPLRCTWCPDRSLSKKPEKILWDSKKCFYGHLCEIHCPTNSLRFQNGVLEFIKDTCTGCRSCLLQCPSKALEFADRLLETDEIMDIIAKDKAESLDFTGVTLAGGEVLNQPEAATELLNRCREEGIHTSIETSGFASPLVFSKVARKADLLIFHLRHYDNKEHVKYTGVPQGKILGNLDTAISMKSPVIVRIPIVPGVSSSLSDAAGFARLLKEHHVPEVELLPYIQTGEKTFKLLAECNSDEAALNKVNLNEYAEVLRKAGIQVII